MVKPRLGYHRAWTRIVMPLCVCRFDRTGGETQRPCIITSSTVLADRLRRVASVEEEDRGYEVESRRSDKERLSVVGHLSTTTWESRVANHVNILTILPPFRILSVVSYTFPKILKKCTFTRSSRCEWILFGEMCFLGGRFGLPLCLQPGC